MAIFRVGADPEALDVHARTIEGYGHEFEQVRLSVAAAVALVRVAWDGPDAGTFHTGTQRADACLGLLSTQFSRFAERLREQAAQQRRTSGGATPSPTTFSPPTATPPPPSTSATPAPPTLPTLTDTDGPLDLVGGPMVPDGGVSDPPRPSTWPYDADGNLLPPLVKDPYEGLPPGLRPTPPKRHEPPVVMVREHSESQTAKLSVLWFSLSSTSGVVQSHNSDGSVTVTLTDGLAVGAEGKLGFDIGKAQAKAEVSIGGDVSYTYGSQWVFATDAEAQSFVAGMQLYAQSELNKSPWNPSLGPTSLLPEGFPDPSAPRPPDITSTEVKVGANAGGEASLPIGPGKDHEAQAGLHFGVEKSWTQSHNAQDGSSTYTTSGTFEAGASAGVDGAKAEVAGSGSADMAITKNAGGQVTQVEVTTTQAVSGGVSIEATSGPEAPPGPAAPALPGAPGAPAAPAAPGVEGTGSGEFTRGAMDVSTLTIPVHDDAQRAVVQQWLDSGGVVTAAMAHPDHRVPGDVIQNLIYDNASQSTVHYTNVTDTEAFSVKVSAAVSLGVDYTTVVSDSTAENGTYLGDSNGSRRSTELLPLV